MTATPQAAALIALLRTRPERMTWNEIAAEVAYEGDALAVWSERTAAGALIADARLDAVLADAQREVEEWAAQGLRLVTVLDPDYPQRLLDIRETPPFLFAAGTLAAEDQGMSVVGSRKATERGLEIASTAARLLVERGLTVIAGLAAGIDTTAHQTALDFGGRTVAFIGTGIRKVYPSENRSLQESITQRGLVLSQFFPDAPPTKQSFPMRNASMSGYGLATIVVEAGEHSGARIQARRAVEHGRPVILTDLVATRTAWGAALENRPGVFVAHSPVELERHLDHVLADRRTYEDALRTLSGSWVA